MDSKRNVTVNIHITPANINDITPAPELLEEIERRLGYLPKYMELDAGYHSASSLKLIISDDAANRKRYEHEPQFALLS